MIVKIFLIIVLTIHNLILLHSAYLNYICDYKLHSLLAIIYCIGISIFAYKIRPTKDDLSATNLLLQMLKIMVMAGIFICVVLLFNKIDFISTFIHKLLFFIDIQCE